MTPKAPEHMVVVKKEDKESKLCALLAGALSDSRAPAPVVMRLLVRSTSSPAAKAVLSLKAELAAAGVELLVILAAPEGGTFEVLGAGTTVRVLSDVRCHDAHELLVLGTATGWVGDCLRRDPATRDSFELHAGSCAPIAGLLTLSFNRLWAMAAPPATRATSVARPLDMDVDVTALPVDQPSQPQAMTRH